MAKQYKDIADRLDDVQMSREERDLAKQQLRSIERTLDFFVSLVRPVQSKSGGKKFRTPAAA